MDRDEIERLIPHRDPFLWIDEVVDCTTDSIHARKRVPLDLDVFRGHFPDQPVLPGVLLCEAALQAGALLISHNSPLEAGHVPVVTRMNNTKFRRIVRPGELLDIHVQLSDQLSNAFFLKAQIRVDGQTAVRLEFACATTSKTS
ncbi:MAG: 3-hydroxyacyl-ACP dehydratase FabZ [Planctomycetaceae bacterium]